jgi:hypothetical protein
MNDEMSSLQQVRTEYEVAKYAWTCVALVEGLTAAQIPATRRKRRRSHRSGFLGPARVTQEPL